MKLWTNGFIHSMESPHLIYKEMATQEGLIVAFDDAIDRHAIREVIDLKQGHLYPGFVDAHLHMMGYGQMLRRVNVTDLKKEAVIIKLQDAFKGQLLYAEGYKNDGLTKEELNQISVDVPIYVRHNDYHSVTVNEKALKLSGLKSDNGYLTEEEANHVLHQIPKYQPHELEEILSESIDQLTQLGLTGGHTEDLFYFNGYEETLDVFKNVLYKKPFRTIQLVHHETLKDHLKSTPFNHPYLTLGGMKVFFDGTISSKTALMKSPYRGVSHAGMKIHSDSAFIAWVKKARQAKMTVAVHVIGDQGLDDLLTILKKYPPQKGQLDRLIHTPYATYATLDRMQGMPITCDIQPQFLSSDMPWSLDYFEKEPELMFPWKSMLDRGIVVSGSSDAPVENPNPLLGIHSAVFRQSRHTHEAFGLHEALTRFEAIKLYSTYAHAQTYASNRGYLKPGYVADFSIFSEDLETMDESKFFEPIVDKTVINGLIVYQR